MDHLDNHEDGIIESMSDTVDDWKHEVLKDLGRE
jgi:hypothetical protein